MVYKYYVYDSSSWRELDLKTGQVAGWREKVKFVYLRNQHLHMACGRSVRRGLQASAEGNRRSAVQDSIRLPLKKRITTVMEIRKRKRNEPRRQVDFRRFVDVAVQTNVCVKHISTQTGGSIETTIKKTFRRRRFFTTRKKKFASLRSKNKNRRLTKRQVKNLKDNFAVIHNDKESNEDSSNIISATDSSLDSPSNTSGLSLPVRGRKKILIVDGERVGLLRNYLVKNSIDVDFSKFDSDENYKKAVIHKYTPIIFLEDTHKGEALKQKNDNAQSISLAEFAQNLGLTSTAKNNLHKFAYKTRNAINKRHIHQLHSDSTSSAYSHAPKASMKKFGKPPVQNSENGFPAKNISTWMMHSDTRTSNSTFRSTRRSQINAIDRDDAVKTPTKKKRTEERKLSSSNKEFSKAEDRLIVDWLSKGNRARRVNGNAVWKEFQNEYPKSPKLPRRTWQSLRNRYLRYILPGLPRSSVASPLATKLRAAAAQGMKPDTRRRNSIFKTNEVDSAWNKGRLRSSTTHLPTVIVTDQTSEDEFVTGAGSGLQTPSTRNIADIRTGYLSLRLRKRDSAGSQPVSNNRVKRSRKLYNPVRQL